MLTSPASPESAVEADLFTALFEQARRLKAKFIEGVVVAKWLMNVECAAAENAHQLPVVAGVVTRC